MHLYTHAVSLMGISLGTPKGAETSMKELGLSTKGGTPEKAIRSFTNNEQFYFPLFSN